jgi:hypothetical protein
VLATKFRENRSAESHGLRAEITPREIRVGGISGRPDRLLTAEVYRAGVLIDSTVFDASRGYRNCMYTVNHSECGLRVLDANGDCVLILDVEEDPYPFMRPRAEQVHITESYTSVPPALTITDTVGAVWTLGFERAPKHRSPDGEFAFPVLRNGLPTGEVASRIEIRGSKVKAFTADGWKVWTGTSFF